MRPLAAIASLAALCVASPAVLAGEAGWAGRRPTILTLVVNDVAHGDSLVLLAGGDALVADSDLRRAGVQIGGALTQTVRDRRYVSLRSLGIRFVAAELDMQLRLTVAADLLPRTRIDLAPAGEPADVLRPRQASAYVRYGLHAAGRADLDDGGPVVDGYAEAGVRLGGALVESTLAVDAGGAVRGLSTARWDDRDDLRSLIAGDQLTRTSRLTGNVVLGGLHLVRAFELDPYQRTAPSLDLDGTVLVPTTADVYVDGALVDRVELPPGTYDLRNLPVAGGINTTRVVLRDRLGRTQEVGGSFYLPPGLLRPGLSDYALSIGFRRDDLARASFAYGAPAATAFYRRGLARRLTAGLHAEAALDVASAGAELLTGSALGQLAGELAVSTSADGNGVAGAVTWSYQGRRTGGALGVRAAGRDFASLGPRLPGDVRREARAALSHAFGRQLTVSLQGAASERRDGDRTLTGGATAGWRLVRGLSLTTSATTSRSRLTGDQWQAMATLDVNLGERTRAALRHQQAGATTRDRLDVHRSVSGQRGVGYRVTAETGERDVASADVELWTGVGRLRAGTWQGPGGGRADVSVSGGVLAVGGRVFLTPPVDRGFVLVRVPDAEGVRVYLENRLVGRTDRRGELLVPDVLAHHANRVAIEPADLPDDRPPPRTSALLAPPRRGAVTVTFEAPPLRLVRGTLAVEHAGRRVTPAYGELVVGAPASFEDPESEEWLSPIGGDGAFEIDGLPAGSYPARILWDGGRCELALTVPASGAAVTRLGAQVCTQGPP